MFTRCLLPSLVLLLTPLHGQEQQEVQRHGYLFEKWVRDTFFGGYEAPSYTQLWDVAAEANTRHGGLPVQIKAIKYGSPISLSDALRQHAISEDFLLIAGYWQQQEQQKKFVNFLAARVTADAWRELWHPITREDLERLDAVVKDRSRDHVAARKAAHAMNSEPPFTEAAMKLHPKIDATGQRRLQCSLSFATVFEKLAPGADPRPEDKPELLGVAAPVFTSGPRSFSRPPPAAAEEPSEE